MASSPEPKAKNDREYGLMWEKVFPFVGALVSALLFHFIGAPFPPVSAYPELMAASGGSAAIFVGFLGTAKAIILTIIAAPAYQALKDAGYAEDLLAYLMAAIEMSIIFAVWSIAMMFVDPAITTLIELPYITITNAFMVGWVFFGVYAILAFWRVSRLMFRLFKLV